MSNTDNDLELILHQYTSADISGTEAVELIKQHFVRRLEPYIGDDFDKARKIIVQ